MTKKNSFQNDNTKTTPIREKDEVKNNPDNKIDQDYPGYPHAPAKEEIIKPGNTEQEKIADIHEKDGEKRNYPTEKEENETDDGSADAFERTEGVQDE